MSFIAILSAAPDNRVGKYAGFETLVEAQAHADAFRGQYPDAFAVETPAAPWSHWRIDMVAKTATIDDAEFVEAEAARLAEQQRLADLQANALRQDMLDKLKTATSQQISTYVDNNVTDLTSARTMLKRIILIMATFVRE